jgi:maltooligosyltrehalose trehalohydrolase
VWRPGNVDMICAVTQIRVWAPRAQQVRLWLDGEIEAMYVDADGFWQSDVEARPGSDYGFLLDEDETVLPDPASRWQPDGVHRASRLYDQAAFEWTDAGWAGRVLPGGLIYELHIGTFTEDGTFDAAIERLPHLVELGVSHVEILPVNAVNGVWNWGYDGVGWYAVHAPYGGPDGFKRFVDACHARGLAVVLDVVYNHLGPSGNYLPQFAPYLKDGRNEWGDLLNLDGADCGPVRRFIIDNALMWLRDYHVDGLRLDAVHALQDVSQPHLLVELAREVDAAATEQGRPLTLIAETDQNDALMVSAPEAGGKGMNAQWDDDVHHALHALLTGERRAYYVDFGPLDVLAKVLTAAFLHDGTYSTFRRRVHGRPVDRAVTPGHRFVVTLQNHDQVGNREAGERITELTTPDMVRIGVVLLLTSAFTPMLWMGEEWAASTRWPYFTSHPQRELDEAAVQKRLDEFAVYSWDATRMINPQDPRAFYDSKLKWSEIDQPEHAQMLSFYRSVIALRRAEPELADPRLDRVQVDYDQNLGWIVVHRGALRVVANVSDQSTTVPVSAGAVLLSTGSVDAAGERLTVGARTAAIVRVR